MLKRTSELIKSHPYKIVGAALATFFIAHEGYKEYFSFSAEVQKAQIALKEAASVICHGEQKEVSNGKLQIDCSDPNSPVVTITQAEDKKRIYSSGGYFRAEEKKENDTDYCTALGNGSETYTIESDWDCANLTAEIRRALEKYTIEHGKARSEEERLS